MQPRKNAPTATTKGSDTLAFRVWACEPAYMEDVYPWKCVAMFRFLQECLDYIAYCQDGGSDVVFQSPAEVRLIRASDRRVVWKPEAVAV